MENGLTLSEKLLLLAVKPYEGGIFYQAFQSLDAVLLGATYLEMTLTGNITIRENRIELLSEKTGTALHALLLEKLARTSGPRKIGFWIRPPASPVKKVRGEIYSSLVQKREIRLEDHHFLFFRWKKPFLHPGNHTHTVISKVKKLMNQSSLLPEEIFLLSLLETAHLLKRIYPESSMRKSARLRIKHFLAVTQSSEAVKQATAMVRAIKAAVAARQVAATS